MPVARCVHGIHAFHLSERHGSCPSVATIWRILTRRGFVTPQPDKRPKSSYVRFEAEMPNERWQADIERHEAPHDRAVMKGHRRQPVAAGW